MNFNDLQIRAKQIREKYAALEKEKYGKEWSREQLVQGFVGDVGDLMKLVMAVEGVREIPDAKNKLGHELADCLWSILVIAGEYEIDLVREFELLMDELEQKLDQALNR